MVMGYGAGPSQLETSELETIGRRQDNPIKAACRSNPAKMRPAKFGEVPEWLKGTDCKSVGYAYAGSNPALSTIRLRRGFGGIELRMRRQEGTVLEADVPLKL